MKYIKLFNEDSEYQEYISGNADLPNVSHCITENHVHYNPWEETRLVTTFNITDTSSATYIMGGNSTSQFAKIEIDGIIQPSVTKTYKFSTTGEHIIKYTLTDDTTIGAEAFIACDGLTSVIIPNSVTTISDRAFYQCRSLTSIIIPNSVTSIGSYTFYDCRDLISIIIPNSIISIGTYAFWGCGSLTSIKVESENTKYDSRDNCNAIIETESNTLLWGCMNTIIPNSVTSIGEVAFSNRTGLTSVTIGSSVTSIERGAFYGCSGLTSIVCNATSAPTVQATTFRDIKTGGTLTVPAGSTGYDVWMGTGNYYLGKYNWTKVEQ